MKLLKSKKATGSIGAVLLFLVFLVVWFAWLGGFIGNIGYQAVANNNLEGVEAFFIGNLNIVVFVCLVLGIMGYMYFGSQA